MGEIADRLQNFGQGTGGSITQRSPEEADRFLEEQRRLYEERERQARLRETAHLLLKEWARAVLMRTTVKDHEEIGVRRTVELARLFEAELAKEPEAKP